MKKLLYIIVFVLLTGCSKNQDDNIDKYAAIENTSGWYGKFVYDSHVYNISCINATNLIDIKEQLQLLNSNIVELLNKLPNNNF